MARRFLIGALNLAVLAALAWADLAAARGWIGVALLAAFSALASGEAIRLILRLFAPEAQNLGFREWGLPWIVGFEAAAVVAASLPGSPLRPSVPALILLAGGIHGLAAARGATRVSPENSENQSPSGLPPPERTPTPEPGESPLSPIPAPGGTPPSASARLRRAGGTALGVVFVLSWIPGLLAWLAAFLLDSPGPAAAYAVVLAAKASDIGGYLVGKRWGRTKIAPSVSPGKSLEGTAGGMALSIAVTLGLRGALGGEAPLPLLSAAGLGAVLALTALLGDLCESLLKRAAGVKDSGRGIPTTGGFLDMIDSLLIAAPVAYLWLHAAGP